MSAHSNPPRLVMQHRQRHEAVDLWTRELALSRHPPMVRLSSAADADECEIVDCSDGPAVIGRSPTSDLHVRDQWVSRRQCAIQFSGEEFSIRDLESRHGTFVNNEKITRTKLHDGDQIRIGLTLLVVSCRD